MSKSQIILIAHGSKDPRWKKPFEKLYNDLKSTLGEEKIALAYMEFISPNLFDVINNAIEKNINDFKILPLFMAGGGHIDRDIPEQIKQIKNQFTNINIELLPPIGEHNKIYEAMKSIIFDNLTNT